MCGACNAGSLVVVDSELLDNTADEGAAVRVVGGKVELSQTLVEGNRATTRGGALFVDGGIVALRNRTLFLRNSAPEAGTIFLSWPGRAHYQLPAPLARYLYIMRGDTHHLSPGAVSVDYPFECGGEAASSRPDP